MLSCDESQVPVKLAAADAVSAVIQLKSMAMMLRTLIA